MPTATTVPLIILVAFLWRFTRGHTLAIVLFTSIFDAASPINFGVLGVSPWLFALGICLVLEMLRGHHRFRFTPGINSVALHLLVVFLGYSLWSGLVYPFLFRGVPVMHNAASAPLSWSTSNFAQLCYLLAVGVVYFIAVSSPREKLEEALRWYVRGCVVAAVFAMYQLANARFHIPYPEAILYSNPGRVIYRAYMINGFWRLNSTFPEASQLATFMTVGMGLLGWSLITQSLRVGRIFCFALMLLTVLLTLSSLGYGCLIFIFISGTIIYVWHTVRHGGIHPAKLVIALVLVTGVAALFALSSEARQTVSKVISSTLLDKENSQSYRERSETDVAAIDTLSHTYYMGAGWGSVRASGLVYMLLGNVGVLGLGIFAALYASLFFPFFSRRWCNARQESQGLLEQSLFGATIMLFGLVAAGAEPVQPILWALLGVATVARNVDPAYAPGLRGRQVPATFAYERTLTASRSTPGGAST